MTVTFADTFYFLALLNPDDSANASAVRWALNPRGPLVTTYWVLTEVADAMVSPLGRWSVVTLISGLRRNPAVNIVPPSEDLFNRGLDLYVRRMDKSWSLTDCISFAVMADRGLTEALTRDHHFEQVGFQTLLRTS
ncbi:MAG: type II toxin-antitoxin system VapC family toxin [Isosphaeraceae bacterium]